MQYLNNGCTQYFLSKESKIKQDRLSKAVSTRFLLTKVCAFEINVSLFNKFLCSIASNKECAKIIPGGVRAEHRHVLVFLCPRLLAQHDSVILKLKHEFTRLLFYLWSVT